MITYSAEETIQWGREFAKRLKAPVLVLLTGDLGTGKTTLTKGLVSGLGAANEDDVTSPTFTFMANRPRSTMPTSTASRVFTTLKHLDSRTCLRSRPSLFWNGRKSFRFPRPGRWFGFDWSTWEAILAGFPCRIPSDYPRRPLSANYLVTPAPGTACPAPVRLLGWKEPCGRSTCPANTPY